MDGLAIEAEWSALLGRGDILHTHRLRALCHAVVVGARTVRQDDPLLTTRECPGPNPVRVVLDTERRLGPDRRVFADGGPPTLLACAEDAPGPDRRCAPRDDGAGVVVRGAGAGGDPGGSAASARSRRRAGARPGVGRLARD